MVIQRTGVGRLALCVSLIASLAACSHSPSEGDAKDAVQARYAGCSYISLRSFDNTNSIPIDDNDYRVEVKYTLRMSPDSDMKDFAKQYADQFGTYESMKADADKKRDAYLAAKQAYEEANQGDFTAGSTYETQHQAEYQEYTNAEIEVGNLGGRLTFNTPARFFQQRIMQSCPNVKYAVLPNFFTGKPDLTDDVDVAFTETLAMMKTDNGWQAVR
ncbi:hypothetical protein AWB81_07458 [Caballeronia arationis]|uniref:hypothetical protein n=1 Tax=Caballeronia arationis TaxID=1777142 RepID=UPI00074CE359|nr:hypothetical protein [Caballeronia arationis]SAL06133.1 hypothetical protein AWB81_07458 [Caballeronia arationis]